MSKNEGLTVQIKAIIDEENEKAREAAANAISKVSKEALKRLKDTSPKEPGGGDYARGWAIRKDGELGAVLYNKVKPGLTHLLENGHLIKNQFGEFGRLAAIPHIKPVEEWANAEVVNEIERRL